MRANSYRQINTDALIKSIQSLPKNNEHSIFCIKAVFIKYNSEEWEYFVGKCEIGTTEEDSETIYSDCAFICKTITDISLAAFLKTVDGEGFTLSQDMPPIKKSQVTQRIQDILFASIQFQSMMPDIILMTPNS